MDVGDPSNFARILDLYGHDHEAIIDDISGIPYSDEEIAATIKQCFNDCRYLLDPHGACGYQALCDLMEPDDTRPPAATRRTTAPAT